MITTREEAEEAVRQALMLLADVQIAAHHAPLIRDHKLNMKVRWATTDAHKHAKTLFDLLSPDAPR